MNKAGRRGISFLFVFLLLLFLLPFIVFFTRQKQDIRPRALSGQANFLLSPSTTSLKVGENFDVLVSLQLTDASLRVSGVDFVLLYDKNKLEVVNLVPQVSPGISGAAFDDAPIVTHGGNFTPDTNFKFLRVAQVARRSDSALAGATVSLARVTFHALAEGTAGVKFPDDNSYLSVVGTSL